MRTKIDAPRLLLIAIALLLLFLWVTSCNPVKRVLNNQEMLEEVAKVVVKGGFCANDTTFITKSDTLVEVDTLVRVDVETHTEIVNDTVYFTKWKTRDITKSTTIHDTIKSFIVDNARVRLLQADSARLTGEVIQWKGKADSRLNWLISLLVIIALFIYLKLKK
jgi:preprotein translocase subunit YajC